MGFMLRFPLMAMPNLAKLLAVRNTRFPMLTLIEQSLSVIL
jgi:hypothetical protein